MEFGILLVVNAHDKLKDDSRDLLPGIVATVPLPLPTWLRDWTHGSLLTLAASISNLDRAQDLLLV